MKRNLWMFILVVCTTVSGVSAQSLKNRVKKLLGKDKSELALNASVLPSPYVNINNKITLADTLDFNAIAEETIFINALSYTIKQGEKGKSNIEALNVSNKSFQVIMQSSLALEDEKASSYTCQLKFLIRSNKLIVCVDSISVVAPTLFGEMKSTAFENLNMQKEKSLQQMQEFTSVYQGFAEGMIEYVAQEKPQSVTHWNEIEAGKVVQGMNETECLLCAGAPKYVRQSGVKTRWMMEGNATIIFEDGKVVSIIR